MTHDTVFEMRMARDVQSEVDEASHMVFGVFWGGRSPSVSRDSGVVG